MLNTPELQSRVGPRASLTTIVSAARSARLDNLRIQWMPNRYRFDWRIDRCES